VVVLLGKEKKEKQISAEMEIREIGTKNSSFLTTSSSFLEKVFSSPQNSSAWMVSSWLSTWDRCYDFLNIFAEQFSEKIGDFDSKQSQILKTMTITLVFKKNAIFFC
jgi:hypothetical protein